MRFLRLTILLPLFLCVLLPALARTEEWQTFTSKEQGFSISFPGIPTEETKPLSKELTLRTTSYMSSGDVPLYLAIQHIEFPPGSIHSDNPRSVQEHFDNLIAKLPEKVSGKLLSHTPIGKDGFPGRELQISLHDKTAVGIFRSYLIDNRNYTLSVVFPRGHQDDKSITRFFDSFTLLPVPVQAKEWQTFTSKAHGFSIRFPGVPTRETKSMGLGATAHIFHGGESDGAATIAYLAQHIEFPSGTRIAKDSASVAEYFVGTTIGMFMRRPGEILSETIIEKDGFPGREIQFTYTDDNLIGTMRSYLLWDKAYLVMVVTPPGEQDNPRVQQFFDSFTLLK